MTLFLALPGVLAPQFSTGEIHGSVLGAGADMLHKARIELRSGQTRWVAQTGSTGDFGFTRLAPGAYDLSIYEDFFRTLTIRTVRLQAGEVRTLAPVALMFEGLNADCNRRSPDFLRPLDSFDAGKGGLGGRIVDDHGRPLADAIVRVYISNVGILDSATTDSSGRFSIPDVPARSRYEIDVAHDGFFTEDFSDFEVQSGYESFYDRIDLAPCEKNRCQSALRPIRPLHACA